MDKIKELWKARDQFQAGAIAVDQLIAAIDALVTSTTHVVVVGNPFAGMVVHGPFFDEETAIEYGLHVSGTSNEWWVPKVEPPEEI